MNFFQLSKLASFFCFSAIDRFDWLRDGLLPLKQRAEDKSVFNKIDQILSEPIEVEWQEYSHEEQKAGDYGRKLSIKHDNMKHELIEILKYFMQIKDYDSSNKIRNILRLLTESSRKFEQRLHYTPRREFAKPDKYLYHGTNGADAYSILKDKTVIKGTAFTNLSLTTDITSASKFGDVILVFDAKRLQRNGAKKMHYYPEKSYLKQFEIGRESESSEGKPFISDIYKYEQEWSVKLPFKFKDGDLIKIIILKDKIEELGEEYRKRAPKERIKQILESISNVPIEIEYVPSYSQRGMEETMEEDVEKGPFRNVIFNKVLAPITEIKNIGGKIVRDEIEKIKKDYPEGAEYLIRNDSIINSINHIYGNIWEPFAHGTSNWDGLLNLNKIMEAIDSAKRVLESENFKYSRISSLAPALTSIRDSRDDVLEVFKKTHLKNDNDYAKAILGYSSSYYFDLKPDLIEWINNNPNKFQTLVLDSDTYKNMIKREGGRETSADYLIEDISNIENMSDEYWRDHPIRLLDHKYFWKMPVERVRDIFKNNPKWHYIVNSTYNDEDALREWRAQRISDENRANYNEVVRVADEEQIVFQKEKKTAFKQNDVLNYISQGREKISFRSLAYKIIKQ